MIGTLSMSHIVSYMSYIMSYISYIMSHIGFREVWMEGKLAVGDRRWPSPQPFIGPYPR